MPLYEYYCTDCNGVFELLRPVREASDAQPCPVCDADSRRLMPTDFAAFVVRDGMPRRIPDTGYSWTLQGESKNPLTSNDPKPEDVVKFEAKKSDSIKLSDEEKVAPKRQVQVRAKKKRGTPAAEASGPAAVVEADQATAAPVVRPRAKRKSAKASE